MRFKLLNPKEFIYNLKKNGEAFKIISTTLTKTIVTETGEYYYSSSTGLKMRELNLIKSVKDHITKNDINARSNRAKIRYIDRAQIKNGTYTKNLYEIDLKSAYWNFALKNRFITKEIFDRGNDLKRISKKARLIALGNLAKKKTVLEFNGVEFTSVETITSEGTENIFFKVSQQTDAVMNALKIIAGKDYLFYWVDAVFINSEMAKNRIEEYLKAVKVEFKTIPINKIQKTKGYIKVWDDSHKAPRPFLFESLKIKDLTKLVD